MNSDEILNMPAGQEMDLLTAWMLIESLNPFEVEINRDDGGNIDCLIWLRGREHHKPVGVYGCPSLSIAICRAVLLAIENGMSKK